MFNNFLKLLYFLKIPKKFVFYLILITFTGSILEIMGLSSLYAFLNNIQPNQNINNTLMGKIFENFSEQQVMFITTIAFCLLFVLKNLIMIFFNFFTYRNLEIVKNKTYQDYFLRILNTNYLEIIREGHVKHGQIFSRYLDHAFNGYLTTYIKMISDIIMAIFIIFFIFYVDFYISLISTIYLTIIASFLIRSQGKKLKANSKEISLSEEKTKQHLFEIIKNFKEIYAYKIQNIVFKQFKFDIKRYLKSEKRYGLTQANLKNYYEMSIIVLIGIIFFYLLSKGMLENSLAILGIIGFSIAKLIPYINGLTANLNALKQVSYSVEEIEKFYENSDKKIQKNIDINQNKISPSKLSSLKIQNLNFGYDNSEKIIKNYDEIIKIGTMNCIVGPSGSGKTTLVDLIMGLIKPDEGMVSFLDQKGEEIKGYSNFAYISQTPCIFKGSLASNITFKENLNEIDKNKLLKILRSIGLFNSLTENEIFNKDIILEGQNLSGGQKQKISIARALYNDSGVLFVDEGTSSLDKKSEIDVYELLKENKSNKIILFITHKILDNSYFDKIIDIHNI